MLQKQEFQQQNVDRIDGEIARYEAELAEILEGIVKSGEDTQNKQEQITQIEETITASHTTQSDAEKKLKEDVEKKNSCPQSKRISLQTERLLQTE